MGIDLLQNGEFARRPTVLNRPIIQLLTGSGYLPDGSDFAGFAQTGSLPWVSIKDDPYNAYGDGLTVDTLAIQAAINDLNVLGGGVIFFPKGRYVSGTLNFYSNITLLGEGEKSVIQYLLGSVVPEKRILQPGAVGVYKFRIEKLAFDHMSTVYGSNGQSPTINVDGTDSMVIDDVDFFNVQTMATHCDSPNQCKKLRVRNSRVHQSAGGGFSHFGNMRDFRFTGNTVENCKDDAIAIQDSATGRPVTGQISGNILRDNNLRDAATHLTTPTGIRLYGCKDVIATKNNIDGTVSSGIWASTGAFNPAEKIVISHNTIENAGATTDSVLLPTPVPGDAIHCDGVNGLVVTANVSGGTRGAQLYLKNCTKFTCSTNEGSVSTHEALSFVSCTDGKAVNNVYTDFGSVANSFGCLFDFIGGVTNKRIRVSGSTFRDTRVGGARTSAIGMHVVAGSCEASVKLSKNHIDNITSIPFGADAAKFVSLLDVSYLGAVVDGVTNDSVAIQAVLNAGLNIGGAVIYVPGFCRINNTLNIGVNNTVRGAGKAVSKLILGANVDLCDMPEGSAFDNITLEGNATTYSGRGITVTGSNGRQTLINTDVVNFDLECIDILNSMGASQSNFIGCRIWRYNAVNNARYSVRIQDVLQAGAYPRKFVNCESDGAVFIDLGGANNLTIVGCVIGGLKYSDNSRAVHLSAVRINNQTALAFKGANHTITGCDILPQITVGAGTNNCAITGNSYNNGPGIIDNSGSSQNTFEPRGLSSQLLENAIWTIPYSAAMTPLVYEGEQQVITPTNGTAYAINAPTSPTLGKLLTLTTRNTTGGALGVPTFNAIYKMTAWVQPANGFSRSITFRYNGTNWVEIGRTAADVPN